MRRVLVLLFTVLTVLAIATGCGGDDSTTAAGGEGGESSPPPVQTSNLTRAQYVKRVNALCLRNEEKQSRAVAAYRKENPESLEEGGGGVEGSLQEVYVPMKEEELEELRSLGAPADDEDEVEAYIGAFEKFVHAVGELEGAPTAAVNRLAIQAGRLAVEYGLRNCS